jgi:hypothetical protein
MLSSLNLAFRLRLPSTMLEGVISPRMRLSGSGVDGKWPGTCREGDSAAVALDRKWPGTCREGDSAAVALDEAC